MMDGVVRAAGMVDVGSGGGSVWKRCCATLRPLLVLAEAAAGDSLATEMLRHPAMRGIPVRSIPTPLTICPGPFTAEAVVRLER